jgi:hypothetical protein
MKRITDSALLYGSNAVAQMNKYNIVISKKYPWPEARGI